MCMAFKESCEGHGALFPIFHPATEKNQQRQGHKYSGVHGCPIFYTPVISLRACKPELEDF